MKDQTFVTILQYAASKNMSFGKYINTVLNDKAKEIKNSGVKMPEIKTCISCGRVPVKFRAWKGQKTSYFCIYHKPDITKFDGYREVSENNI